MADRLIAAVAPWYGGNRILAKRAGVELGRCTWCAVPFAGGMPELAHIDTRAGVASDLHRHVINLARVIASEDLKPRLASLLEDKLFHPDELRAAQDVCVRRHSDAVDGTGLFADPGLIASVAPDVDWAAAYFVACWMGRGGMAGQDGELRQQLSVRYTPTGGSSAKRFSSAVASLEHWHRVMRGRWEFTCGDRLDLMRKASDAKGVGVYLDPPWPFAGERYAHRVPRSFHARVAEAASRFVKARVVVRYGDDPLIRQLYPERLWTWIEQSTKSQQGGEVREVLIVNGPAFGAGAMEDPDVESEYVQPEGD